MSVEKLAPLDPETLALFAAKGSQGGPGIVWAGNANGVKVRRVMQIVGDLAGRPFDQLRILDLACGEGVYSIEAALRGAEVLALDARTERMDDGRRAAERLGLTRLRFELTDIRKVCAETHGQFDAVLFLGILYHLDAPDVLPVLRNVHGMCRHLLVIDTHVALRGTSTIEYGGSSYEGTPIREHGDQDTETVRKARLLASLDNTWSFWFTPASLFRLLTDIGFTSVYECAGPPEPFKPENRRTVVAVKGQPVKLASYPWVNDRTEGEIEAFLKDGPGEDALPAPGRGLKQRVKGVINGMLRPLGFEVRRVE